MDYCYNWLMEFSIAQNQVLTRIVLGSGINLLLASAAFKRQSVSVSGALSGLLTGIVIYVSGGIWFWLHLGAFFISSTLLGRFKQEEKAYSTAQHEKHGRRDGIQVISNTGPGALAALLYFISPDPAFYTAFAAAFAAANADTWAGEIGMLSARAPVSILTSKPLPTGASGGVTLLGLTASAAGAAFIAAVSSGGVLFYVASQTLQGASATLRLAPVLIYTVSVAAIVTLSGFLGSVIDSLLGASLQAEYLCSSSGQPTERPYSKYSPNTLIKGYRLITNDTVNLLSVSAAALAALIVTKALSALLPGIF